MTPALDWARLFRTEAPRLRRFLRRRFGPFISPEDIAQETFERLCAIQDTAIASPRAYLYRTAKNLAMNDIRHQLVVPMITVPDPDQVETESKRGSKKNSCESEELIRMREMLDALAPHLRDALMMHRLEGLNDNAIAKRMGVSRATVHRYLAEAMHQCHNMLFHDHDGD